MTINRYTPYRFKNGKQTKNRVVVPAMASQTADASGFATELTVQHYENLAKSDAGLIFVEYTFIHRSGRGEANQLGVDTDQNIQSLKKIVNVLHVSSAIAGLQLVHAGGKSSTDLTGAPLMGPSAVAVPVKGWSPDTPTSMSEMQIQNWINWFTNAAGRSVDAGFDLVELHAAHGYGLNQWLSPLTNKRSDKYGGTIEGRSRLLFEIVKKIKAQYPGLLLSVRLPAQDYIDGGLTVKEMIWVVSELQQLGCDLINVSSGIGGWRRPLERLGQGYLVVDALEIKSQTHLPVIGVGGIETGEYIDEILQASSVDFAAVGRAILLDPAAWRDHHLPKH